MWCGQLTHWKRLWCWESLRAGGEGDNRGWDGWMASLTQWRWVWVNSRSWWWTGRPDVLQSTRLQTVRHDWATELNWTEGWPPRGLMPMCTSQDCCYQCLWLCPWGKPLPTQAFTGDPPTLIAGLVQSLLGTLLLCPGSWWAQDFYCALQESVPPVLWMFCNQIPLFFKVRLPGNSQSLGHIKMLGSLLWGLEPHNSEKTSLVLLFCSLWATYLAGMGFDFNVILPPPTVSWQLLLCPWMWGIFFWGVPTSSCPWSFST